MNKAFFVLATILVLASVSMGASMSSFTDDRDGQTYETVVIDGEEWFAQNLNYKGIRSFCYEGKRENCKMFGRMYTQPAAKEACPEGWHLPNDSEWMDLIKYGDDDVNRFKDKSWPGKSRVEGLGFNALPGGSRDASTGKFNGLGNYTFFSTSTDMKLVVMVRDTIHVVSNMAEENAVYVRCIKGIAPVTASQSSVSRSQSSSFRDRRDDRTYRTTIIGGVEWFAENLAYNAENSSCFTDDALCAKYGRFYGYKEARNACPAGTRLATGEDWRTLLKYLEDNSEDYDVGYLISAQESGREDSYEDPYGFSILYAGRIKYEEHDYRNVAAHFWVKGGDEYLSFDRGSSYADWRSAYDGNREMSVRCVVSR